MYDRSPLGNRMNGAMDSRYRIDAAEEARHRQVMDSLGVYDADWAVSRVLEQSDVQLGQNRLLFTEEAVRGGSIPEVFPELEELRDDGLNVENRVSVKVLDAEGREKDVCLRYLKSNKAYRVIGSDWRRLVEESRMRKGDRLDFYTCRRGDGDRCLFVFSSKDGGDSSWCNRMNGAMDSRCRIDPAEEARRRQAVMDGLGVYDAHWALSKVLMQSDVQAGQNRLLLTKEAVRAGPIPELFPELEELRDDGLNAQNTVTVTVLDAEGREKDVNLRFLNSIMAYRIIGSQWRRLVEESRMYKGDRLDFYTCRRGDGERCLFLFRSQGSCAGDTSRSNSLVLRRPGFAARQAVVNVSQNDPRSRL